MRFLNYVIELHDNTGLQSITVTSIKKQLLDLKHGGSSEVISQSFRPEKTLKIIEQWTALCRNFVEIAPGSFKYFTAHGTTITQGTRSQHYNPVRFLLRVC